MPIFPRLFDTIGADTRLLSTERRNEAASRGVSRGWSRRASIKCGKGLCARDATKKWAGPTDISVSGPVGDRPPVSRDGKRRAGAGDDYRALLVYGCGHDDSQ